MHVVSLRAPTLSTDSVGAQFCVLARFGIGTIDVSRPACGIGPVGCSARLSPGPWYCSPGPAGDTTSPAGAARHGHDLSEPRVDIAKSVLLMRAGTRFAFRIVVWTHYGPQQVAGSSDFAIAKAAFRTACERWPSAVITLEQGSRIIEDTRRGRIASQ